MNRSGYGDTTLNPLTLICVPDSGSEDTAAAADNGGFNTSIPVLEKDSGKVARKYPSGMKGMIRPFPLSPKMPPETSR
jgi:hypothetical protein